MEQDIAHTVLAIKKFDAKSWTCWRMVELAFLGCLFLLAWVVPPYGLVLPSVLVIQGAGLNFEMWILCVEYCGCRLLPHYLVCCYCCYCCFDIITIKGRCRLLWFLIQL